MNDKMEISLLYDFYGGLLNPSQQKVIELSVNDDLSYAEAAELLCISRQGVKDSLDRAVRKLYSFEEKLMMLSQYKKEQQTLETIITAAQNIRQLTDDSKIKKLSETISASAYTIYDRED